MNNFRDWIAVVATWLAKAHEVAPGVPSSMRTQTTLVCLTVCVSALVLVESVALGLIKDVGVIVALSGFLVGLAGAYLTGKVKQHQDE